MSYRPRPMTKPHLEIEQVKQIKQLLKIGFKQRDIAPVFDKSTQAISKIATGEAWKNVELEEILDGKT